MKRTVLAASLLAALAMPAFADDATTKIDKSPDMTKVDRTTTSSTTDANKQTRMAPTVIEDNMYRGCMHHDSTLNMM